MARKTRATSSKKREPPKSPLPPSTEIFAMVKHDGEPVTYDCGHLYAPRFALDPYGGEEYPFDNAMPEKRKLCGDCMLPRLRRGLVRCAMCGHAIPPGDLIVLYDKSDAKNEAWCFPVEMTDGATRVVGHADWRCKNFQSAQMEEGFYWTGSEVKSRF